MWHFSLLLFGRNKFPSRLINWVGILNVLVWVRFMLGYPLKAPKNTFNTITVQLGLLVHTCRAQFSVAKFFLKTKFTVKKLKFEGKSIRKTNSYLFMYFSLSVVV